MPTKSFIGLAACLMALSSCTAEAPPQASSDPSQTRHCVASDFGAPKGQASSPERSRSYVLPPEIEQIHRGVYELVNGSEMIFTKTWIGIDFDRSEAIRVERIFGVLYGPAIGEIRQTQTAYFREERDWVEIVSVRQLRNEELDALTCPANDLWSTDRNERDTRISGVSSELTLRDGDAEKTFAGAGNSGGDAGAYAQRLDALIPRTPSSDMDRVRRAILHDGIYGFISDIPDRVFFNSDDATLTPAAKHVLDRWIYYLTRRPKLRFKIEGYADDPGSDEHNTRIARRRVTAVKDYLAEHGVDLLRIETASFGNDKPAVVGGSEGARAQNRRVVGHPE